MNNNDILRKDCKLLKAKQGISYKELAEHLEIKESSFYNWLYDRFNLSCEKQQRLKTILSDLTEMEE